jgi:DNA-binding transcriptional ArsR family regulator
MSIVGRSRMDVDLALRALASERRLQILEWLKNPVDHFPAQVYGDLVKDGVCGVLIADKLKVSQPTASEHLKILAQAGFVRPKRIRQWTFYKRDETAIRTIKKLILAKI